VCVVLAVIIGGLGWRNVCVFCCCGEDRLQTKNRVGLVTLIMSVGGILQLGKMD
jgi:hypothetical protein